MAEKKIVDRMLELGLGIAAYGEEKVAGFVKDVTAKGETKRGDVEKMKKEFKKKSESLRKEFVRRVNKEVEGALKKMNLATVKEVAALKKRIDKLESKIKE
ncbi:MAG: phasin family protein [Candidatus Ratteibacteria bacterium]